MYFMCSVYVMYTVYFIWENAHMFKDMNVYMYVLFMYYLSLWIKISSGFNTERMFISNKSNGVVTATVKWIMSNCLL